MVIVQQAGRAPERGCGPGVSCRFRLRPIAMRPLALLGIALALAGCSASYGPEGLRGVYSEQQRDANVFRITFKGNITNKQAETDDLALLRAAQVAQAHGFAWFVTSGIAPTGTAA